MQDFDEKRAARLGREADELTFKIGGETFVVKPAVRPEVWVDYWDQVSRFSTLTNTEQLLAMDSHIEKLLEEEYVPLWAKVRQIDTAFAITFKDIADLIEWLWSVQTSRPTGGLSDSSEQPDASTTPSTPASPSPAST